jgi:BirA family biotin operon repressor/biotin-[acetyl-CoA-carboxylase] ligase
VTVDSAILSALRAAGERSLSGADLACRTGLAIGTVRRHVEGLRALGYEIEASPHLGYRLAKTPDVLHADDLISRLGKTRVIGRDIRVFRETTSTNDVADKLARDGVKEGVVVFAESQTQGRGRLGRKWISPPGKGLWFTVLLRPQLPPELVTQITIASATALSRAIRSLTDLRPEIKWPNDLLLGGKKVAGILTELSAELDTVRWVLLGIGVDANLGVADFPHDLRKTATSLRIELGHPIERAALATGLLKELDQAYAQLNRGAFEALADEWEHQCSTLGHEVTIHVGQRRIRGRAESLDPGGALLVRTHHGHLERVMGGDVTLEK